MGSSKGLARLIALAFALTLATALAGAGVAGANDDRAASAEAKQHCQKLKDKIKGKKGKAKAKAKAKYKKCLQEYDEENPPDAGGGGTTDPGTGGTTDPGAGGGTGTPPQQQCTSLESCPQLTRNDTAGQQAMGAETILERAEFGSSGQTAEYYRLFFYGGGAWKGVAVDWNTVSGEICRQRVDGTWSFKAGYTYTVNGGGVLVEVNLSAGGQSGTEILDFRNGAGSSVYVGPQAVRFEENPQAKDQC